MEYRNRWSPGAERAARRGCISPSDLVVILDDALTQARSLPLDTPSRRTATLHLSSGVHVAVHLPIAPTEDAA